MSKIKIISSLIGAGTGVGVGVLSQINYENRLRIQHPTWTEDQIRKAVKKRKIKAGVIGGIGGTALGYGVGYMIDKLPKTSRSNDDDFGDNPYGMTKSSSSRRSSRTSTRTSRSTGYKGKGKSKEYQQLCQETHDAAEVYKSMAESGNYRKNDPELVKARKRFFELNKDLHSHPESDGIYKDRLVVKESYKPDSVEVDNRNQVDKYNSRYKKKPNDPPNDPPNNPPSASSVSRKSNKHKTLHSFDELKDLQFSLTHYTKFFGIGQPIKGKSIINNGNSSIPPDPKKVAKLINQKQFEIEALRKGFKPGSNEFRMYVRNRLKSLR